MLSETDTETGMAGTGERTSVIDTVNGSSVTYQDATPVDGQLSQSYSDEPPQLTEGPEPTNAESWFAALPTDPATLGAKLLSMARAQLVAAGKLVREQFEAFVARTGAVLHAGPQLTDDDLVYQEADTLLWSPLVQPGLRSALYQVIAAIPGVSVANDATDPAGRPAVAMSYTYGAVTETDTTYENPSTGAVLAQVWASGTGADRSVITAVYQPVTASSTLPPDPYAES